MSTPAESILVMTLKDTTGEIHHTSKETASPAEEWREGRSNAKTVEEKIKYNVWDVWDDFKKHVLTTVESAVKGKWSWYKNRRCKYIEVRIDMRTGHCIIKDMEGKRITPEELSIQNG